MKRCPKCGQDKELSDFASHSGERDGLQRHCRACAAAYMAARYRRNREKVLAEKRALRPSIRVYVRTKYARRRAAWLAENGPCQHCGSNDRLEVDHIDPNTKTSVRVWHWNAERRAAELAKCQVLCEKCHLVKTAMEQKKPITHGTHSGYTHYKCRCVECRAAHAARGRTMHLQNKAWRDRNPEACLRYRRKWGARNLEKRRAQWRVKAALQRGEIRRPVGCTSCGVKGRVEAHHADYSKPLDVTWLCRLCHKFLHRKPAEAAA